MAYLSVFLVFNFQQRVLLMKIQVREPYQIGSSFYCLLVSEPKKDKGQLWQLLVHWDSCYGSVSGHKGA